MSTSAKNKPITLPIDQIVIDPNLQMRAGGVSQEHVNDLREAITNGNRLPPVQVREVEGKGKLLTDGFHTVQAQLRAGNKEVEAYVQPGSWTDAVIDACAANQQHHALKRTNADKNRAVACLLKALAEAGVNWSKRVIAAKVGVSAHLVDSVRAHLRLKGELKEPQVSEPTPDGTPPQAVPPAKVQGADRKMYPATPASKSSTPGEAATGKSPPAGAAAGRAAYDFARQFEPKCGVLIREIDELGTAFGVNHTPRADELRQLLRDFLASARKWHEELRRVKASA